MDCSFCTEFAQVDVPDRIITATDGWVLIPTVGCFTPGYCLVMPVDHVDAIADAADLDQCEDIAENMRAVIASSFGPTIIAEHGARGCDLGASCCSHAHLHFIPVAQPDAVEAAYRTTGGDGVSMSSLVELPNSTDGGPYVYLSPRSSVHRVWPAAGFARQYVRRVCSRLLGVGEYYDWRDHPFPANQQVTLDRLRAEFRSRHAA